MIQFLKIEILVLARFQYHPADNNQINAQSILLARGLQVRLNLQVAFSASGKVSVESSVNATF